MKVTFGPGVAPSHSWSRLHIFSHNNISLYETLQVTKYDHKHLIALHKESLRQSMQDIILISLLKTLRVRNVNVTPWLAASWKWRLDIALDSRKYTFSCARIWGHLQCICPLHSPTAFTCSRPTRRYLKNLDGDNQRRDRHRNLRIRISQYWRAGKVAVMVPVWRATRSDKSKRSRGSKRRLQEK